MNMSFQRIFYVPSIVLILFFSFKYYQSTPFEPLFSVIQAGFLGFILLFLIAYVASGLVKHKNFDQTILYFLLLMLIIPFYSAYRAQVEFGQPFIYGLLSEREWLLFGVGIWFYYVLTTKKISLSTLEFSFVFMSWASLMLFSLFVLTFDPSQLENSEVWSRLVYMTENRGLRFKFQTYFITVGAIYYFVKYNMNKNRKDLLFLFIFLVYVIFIIQGRIYMIFLAMTFLLYYWMNYSFSRMIILFIKLSLLSLLFLIILQVVMPEYLEKMGHLFVQMFKVLSGNISEDVSANARIYASLNVLDYFETHPMSIWLGTGSVSNQWNDGYNSIFGYFYPSDIGVLGGVFLYGMVGFIFLWIIPFIAIYKSLRKLRVSNNIFMVTINYLLIYALLRSVQGTFYFQIATYIIPLFILLAYQKLQRQTYVKQ